MIGNSNEATILLVDDDAGILAALERTLREKNLNILCSQTAQDALGYFKTKNIAMVVVDLRMPGKDGIQILRDIAKISPGTIRMLISGYCQFYSLTDYFKEDLIYHFIEKPWDDVELKLLIQHGLEKYRLEAECKRLKEVIHPKSANR